MDDDLVNFKSETISSARSENSLSIADSTCSDLEKNAIRRRLIDLDQSINQLERECSNVRKGSSKTRDQLITVIDRLENYKEIDEKYQIMSDCVDTPLAKLEKSVNETVDVLKFSDQISKHLS